METITRENLVNELLTIKGATFAEITTLKPPKMRKTGNPWVGRVLKRSTVNATINWSYKNKRNKILGKQGEEQDFIPQPRKWGERLAGTPLISHKGRMYVEALVTRVDRTTYEKVDNGQPLTTLEVDTLKAHIDKYTPRDINLCDYSVDTIVSINFNGKQYKVID